MNYEIEMTVCAENIARWVVDAGWQWSGEYELTDADCEYLRGEQPDSLECLPFADESVQAAFERDVQATVNEILEEVAA